MNPEPLADAQSLDRVLHERRRLAIVSALAPTHELSFRELKESLQLTDGNLSVHLKVLEEAGYIEVTKTFVKRRPQTRASLTPAGREALSAYIDQLETIIQHVRSSP